MTITKTQLRNLGLLLGTAVMSSIATMLWSANRGVDLYALIDNLNTFVKDLITLVTTIGVLVTTVYGVIKSATKPMLEDATKAPDAVQAASEIPASAKVVAVAEALKNGH